MKFSAPLPYESKTQPAPRKPWYHWHYSPTILFLVLWWGSAILFARGAYFLIPRFNDLPFPLFCLAYFAICAVAMALAVPAAKVVERAFPVR